MASADFSAYLQYVSSDRRFQETLFRYTATDAVLTLEAQVVKREESNVRQLQALREPIEPEPVEPESIKPEPVLLALRTYAVQEHVLLAGRPGSGKSTTLKRLLLEMAQAALEDEGQSIPVFVQLKSDRSVMEAIAVELSKGGLEFEEKEIKRLLRQKQLFLLLDGVNEIPSESLRKQLQQFRDDYPATLMIFTTRDLAAGGHLGIQKRLEMQPLTELQMQEFVGKYLPEQGEILLESLQDRLREVAETPLLLKMLCEVFAQTGKVITNKGELFRQFDQKYDEFKGIAPVSAGFRQFKPGILRHLALRMMQGDPEQPTEAWLTIERSQAEQMVEDLLTGGRVAAPGEKAKEWLEDLLEHHLLQVAENPREIEFHHQLFQEYYAAEALLLMIQNTHPDIINKQRFQYFYLNYLKWTEPVALMMTLLESEAQAVRIVKLAFEVDLFLGTRLIREANPRFQRQMIALIYTLKLPRQFQFFGFKFKLFRKISQDFITELLSDTKSTVASEIAVEDLLNRLEPDGFGGWHIIQELGKIGSKKAIPALLKALKNKYNSVRAEAASALGKIGSDQAFPELLNALTDPDETVRRNVAEALGKIASEQAIPGLFRALTDSDDKVREEAAIALVVIGSEQAIPGLLHALQDPSKEVRYGVAVALHSVNSELVIDGLFQMFRGEERKLKLDAIEALIQIRSERVVDELIKTLRAAKDSSSAALAAMVLGDIASEQAVLGLLESLKDSKSYVKFPSAEALGVVISRKSPPEVDPEVLTHLESLKDSKLSIRFRLAYRASLDKVGSSKSTPEIVSQLLEALEPELFRVDSKRVSTVLGEILNVGSKIASEVLSKIAIALGETDSKPIVSSLLKAKDAPDQLVQKNASKALRKIRNAFRIKSKASSKEWRSGVSKALSEWLDTLANSDDECEQIVWMIKTVKGFGAKQAITQWLNDLDDPDEDVRAESFHHLSFFFRGYPVGEWLPILKLFDAEIYEQVGQVWVEACSQSTAVKLLKAMDSDHQDIRVKAAFALVHIGYEPAIPRLLQALEDSDDIVRRVVSSFLGIMDSNLMVAGLVNILKEGKSEAQQWAAHALALIGSEQVVDELLEALKFENASMWAACALKQIASERAVLGLIASLKNPYTRSIAAESLGEIGSKQPIPTNAASSLLKAFTSWDVVLYHAFNLLKALISSTHDMFLLDVDYGEIAEALGKVGQPEALPHLRHEYSWREAVSAIQGRYQFYNYDIFQSSPILLRSRPASTTIVQGDYVAGDKIVGDKIMGDQTTNIDRVGNYNAGDVTIHRDQIGDNSN